MTIFVYSLQASDKEPLFVYVHIYGVYLLEVHSSVN